MGRQSGGMCSPKPLGSQPRTHAPASPDAPQPQPPGELPSGPAGTGQLQRQQARAHHPARHLAHPPRRSPSSRSRLAYAAGQAPNPPPLLSARCNERPATQLGTRSLNPASKRQPTAEHTHACGEPGHGRDAELPKHRGREHVPHKRDLPWATAGSDLPRFPWEEMTPKDADGEVGTGDQGQGSLDNAPVPPRLTCLCISMLRP